MVDDITRRRLLQGAGAVGVAGLVGTGTTAGQSRDPPGRHIVGVEPGKADVARREADEVYLVLDFDDIGMAVSGWYSEDALDNLRNNPNVRYIEENGELELHDHTVDEDDGDPSEEQVLPWGIDRVDADEAHHEDETAEGAEITIIDTGIDPSHETLEANVAGGKAWVECSSECEEDWDDDHSHGTHVAGTANAVDNEVGVVGSATEADMYAAKVCDDGGSCSWDHTAAALEWAAEEGHDVANISLGGRSGSETLEDAVEHAYSEGVLIVSSAGNEGPAPNSVTYPAAYEDALAVSATDEDDDIARFSSRGDEVELAAPGVDVLSSIPDDEYDESSGTSMSAPHVSGAGAHLMDPETDMSNEEAREQLKETAEDIGLDEEEQGAGLVNIAAALGIEDDEEEESLAVETHDATDVDESSATLNGELTELEGYEEATVYFEWGESGDDLPQTTAEQTLEDTGVFDDQLEDLESDTEYEFRAVAEANDDSDTGDTLTFTTENGEDNEETTAPTIDEFELTDTSNPRWARVEVDWAVSDDDGNLDEVTTEAVFADGSTDSESSSVSGDSASGTHEHRERDAHGEVEVTLTVSDTDGNETSESETEELG